ncbi:Uncharacterised protein [[Pasteurella] aerogenes]|nr:Uncharacterised protein [[Pasteurella] aerogenes]
MEEIIKLISPLLKEVIMQYGLYEITACVAFVVLIWQFANILNAVKSFFNK